VAWGLALERLASLLFDVSDIRQLVGHEVDLGFIRNYKYSEIKF
jgi:phenylalanyl-tRNA synthetase alpha subunit